MAKPAQELAGQVLRPEWLFEVVNRLQPFAAPPGDPCAALTADSVFETFPPQSELEQQLKRGLLARLKLEDSISAHVSARHADHLFAPSVDAARGLAPESTRVNSTVERARLLLQRDFATHWTVDRIARRVGCNRTDLEGGFRSRISHTMHGYLVICRVDAAKVLLRTTAWRVEEVAKAAGYRSKVSLYEQFRRVLRMTPDEYRRRWMLVAPSTHVRWLLSRMCSD